MVIYFCSGTGNSFRAANWMAEEARARGVAARIIPIEEARPEQEVSAGPEQLLGLAFPTHGFTAPWHMLRFLFSLPRRDGTHALVMPVRGGVKVGSVFLPGIEGSGGYVAAAALTAKGYAVRCVQGLDMPVNWTVVVPAPSQESVEAIMARARARVAEVMERVLSGGQHFGGFVPLVLGFALLPISFAYLLMGRLFFSKLFYASDSCNGCGICAQNCAVGAVRMRGRPPRPYWTFSCESCMRCTGYCPRGAVEASYPLAAAVMAFTSAPVTSWLLRWLFGRARLPRFHRGLPGWLVYPYQLLTLFAGYALFDRLMRLPRVNRILTALTPTHYYRRYHEPGTRLRELKGGGHIG